MKVTVARTRTHTHLPHASAVHSPTHSSSHHAPVEPPSATPAVFPPSHSTAITTRLGVAAVLVVGPVVPWGGKKKSIKKNNDP